MPDWIVYRYFPEARERLSRFPSSARIDRCFKALLFEHIQVRREYRGKQEKLNDFLVYAKQRYRTSQLMVLSEKGYQEGLERIHQDIQEISDEEMLVNSELSILKIRAGK